MHFVVVIVHVSLNIIVPRSASVSRTGLTKCPWYVRINGLSVYKIVW